MHDQFWFDYDQWQKRALDQFKTENPDWNSGHIEVCEDGSVYLGNLMWFPKLTVEPWKEN